MPEREQRHNDELEAHGFERECCPRCGETGYLTSTTTGLWDERIGGYSFGADVPAALCALCGLAEGQRKEHAYALFSAHGIYPLPAVEDWQFDYYGAPIPPDRWPISGAERALERSETFETDLERSRGFAVERMKGGQPPII